MDNKTRNASAFFTMPPDRPDLAANQRDLYRTLYAALSYIPILQGFITLGFGTIYLLSLMGLLETNEPRLLIVSAISAAAALLHLPLFSLLRRGKLNEVAAGLLIINGLMLASPVLIWQNIIWLPIILVSGPSIVFATQRGLHRNYRIGSFIFGVILVSAIFAVDHFITYKRMIIGNSLGQMAAVSIYLMIIIAMAALVIMNSRITFFTISSRLVTIFTFVALLSSITTLLVAALANIYNDRQKVFLELNAASSVRTVQIQVNLDNLGRDVNLSLKDPTTDRRIQYILSNKPGEPIYQSNYDLVQVFLEGQLSQNSRYQEILLLDGNGKSLISTTQANKGIDFSSYNFFQNILKGINYAVEYNFPTSFDQSSIILARPIIVDGFMRGAIIARTSFESINQIVAAKTGVGETAETYLVALINGKMVPISNTRKIINSKGIITTPTTMAILERVNQDFGIWDNYSGKSVLGSFVRIPALNAVLIAEVEQQEITQKTVNISLTNAIIGIFTLLLSFAIVFITSLSISFPIVDMAQKASSLANGELATRMQVERQDEIGTLASSFNSMAGELQALVKTLEQKVEDRTGDLQKQANYLRVAAEVARDATTAQDLDDLLNRASKLVLDRFGFYHTGIFLLDERKEYAILRASPTAAGREMLGRNHRLKVGQVGIVGNVAATGVSRISLDTGLDSAFFNNPSLPNTRSEMALPLKVGDEMIGVIDVQSEKPEAFTQDDIGILQIMADQLALAIQRVRLTEEQQDNLRQLETANQSFTLSSWNSFSRGMDSKQGYTFDGMHILPLESFPSESQDALTKGRTVVLPPLNKNDINSSALAVPLKLRDQIIGILRIQFSTETISTDTISLVEETAGRLAIALENARLYTETQKIAERERAISEVSNRLTASVNIENILRATVQEIGRMLPGAEVIVRLEQNSAPESTTPLNESGGVRTGQ